MPMHTVSRGDSIPSLAHTNGHFWETLWNHPQNAELKKLRKTPNILNPGDEVFIPEIRIKTVDKATDATHKFERRGVPAKLRMKLMMLGEPRKNEPYTITLDDGKTITGNTDGEGMVEAFITPNCTGGKLVLTNTGEEIPISLGHLNPIDTISGIRQRLSNLGFPCGEGDEIDEKTKTALTQFQGANNLPQTGEPDSATTSLLQSLHP